MSEPADHSAPRSTFSGIGLHGGEQATVVFKPAPANWGIRFVRTDLPERPEIRVDVDNTSADDHSRRTVLRQGSVTVNTVEHVLAAVHGLGIDNLTIEINRPEPAEPDGSSRPYVEILKRAGVVDHPEPKRYIEVKTPVGFSEDGIELMALPYDGLKITFTVHYDHACVGTQYASFDISAGDLREGDRPGEDLLAPQGGGRPQKAGPDQGRQPGQLDRDRG